MYLRVRELLTPEQRKDFTCLSEDMSDWEINQYYSFSDEDIKIINHHRREHNRLGFAVQLCMLRFPGWLLTPETVIPHKILKYIADQINVSVKEYTLYFKREATRYEHLEELRQQPLA